ncbi:Pnap_2097 family protein [Acidisoma sp.]|uniref:Pnap_2097 family protein n=1 Tax=Acidisoma sp. TaxID=1872115 RepID=UPI003B0003EA
MTPDALEAWPLPSLATVGSPYDGMARSIVLGMPQLCRDGLSETWLLKDIGHRHWTLLAYALGLSLPEFEDAHGAAVHAAFNAVSLRHGDLGAARANAVLDVASDLTRLSNTQFRSVHRLSVKGRPVAEVEVISTFVKRMTAGVNRSAAAATPLGLPPLIRRAPLTGFAAEASALRAERWQAHFGFERSAGHAQAEFIIDACPAQDFNGAGYLYCAMFQAFVDRAEWSFFRITDLAVVTRRRDIIYRGNIDVGDRVVISLLAVVRDDHSLTHWCRLTRESGRAILADIFTARALSVL